MEQGSLTFRMVALCVATTCVTLVAGCSDGGGGGAPAPSIASVTISSPTTSAKEGDTLQLTAEARDQFGAVVPATTAAWSVSDANLAAISPAGVLQAFHEGNVVVTATISGVSGTLPLTFTPIRVSVTVGAKEVVFVYATDRCADLDLPDGPPRLVRAEDGSVVLFAGDAPSYFVSRGADVGSLKRDCSRPALISADRRAPGSYENWEWIWVVYREDNRWHALIHNEFHDAVAGTCRPGDPSPANPCGYDSVTYGVSTDGARSFSKPFAPAHVVAPPPNVRVPPPPNASPSEFIEGFRSPSNIVRGSDGLFYSLVYAIPSKANPNIQGLCPMRTEKLDDPASWRAWDGTGYNLQMTSPYVTGSPAPVCAFIKFGDTAGGNASLTFNTYLGRYMLVNSWYEHCGIYFRLSSDLVHWSAPQLIVQSRDDSCSLDIPLQNPLESVLVMFTSVIDHADMTVNFERPGRTPYLYYVRFNKGIYDPISILDRDVVRVPLTFTRLD